jgi:hypothetical protein
MFPLHCFLRGSRAPNHKQTFLLLPFPAKNNSSLLSYWSTHACVQHLTSQLYIGKTVYKHWQKNACFLFIVFLGVRGAVLRMAFEYKKDDKKDVAHQFSAVFELLTHVGFLEFHIDFLKKKERRKWPIQPIFKILTNKKL